MAPPEAPMDSKRAIRRALLSVSDKTGLVELARALQQRGIELISTGGTARTLAESGIPVREVADVTGFPEIMDGRVKTLHPKVHGGLLGRRGTDEAVMAREGIEPIDLLVVNLYPFARTIAKPGVHLPRGHREHRYRRSRDASRGGEEPCRCRSGRRSCGLRGTAGAARGRRLLHGFHLPRPPRREGLRAYGRVRHAGGGLPGASAGRACGSRAFPPSSCWQSRVLRNCDMARIRTSARRSIACPALPRTASPVRGWSRARNSPSTTSSMRTPRSSASASSITQPASSSSTPIPVASPWPRRRSRPTSGLIAPTRPRPLAASSPSTGPSRPPRRRPSSTASLSRC